MVILQQLEEAVTVRHVGNVRRIGHKGITFGLGLLAGLRQLVLVTTANDGDSTGFRKLVRSRKPNPRRPSRNEHYLASDSSAQGTVDMQVRIKMALPVVPKTPSVILQMRTLHTAALEHCLCIAGVEACGVIHKVSISSGKPRSL